LILILLFDLILIMNPVSDRIVRFANVHMMIRFLKQMSSPIPIDSASAVWFSRVVPNHHVPTLRQLNALGNDHNTVNGTEVRD
jgi:hypothetical protein